LNDSVEYAVFVQLPKLLIQDTSIIPQMRLFSCFA